MKKVITSIVLSYSLLFIFFSCEKVKLVEPKLIASSDTLYFIGTEIKELVLTTNPTSKSDYEITSFPNWLRLSSTYGTIDNDLEKIYISSDFTTSLPGIYEGEIKIFSTSGSKNVYVKGFVGQQVGYLIPDTLFVSIEGDNQNFTFKNIGNVNLNYALTASNNFISFPIPTGNISQFQESNISFKVNRNNMSSGTYYSQMFLNINNKLDTIQVKIENFKEQKIALQTNIIDAEYSKKRDIIVYISSDPTSKINIYDIVTGSISSIDLEYVPTCVSISSDGNTAAVGHDSYVSYVDLANKKLIRTYFVSCNAFDIVLGNNKWAYVFPIYDQWVNIHCINLNLQVDNELLNSGNSIYARTKGKLQPSSNFIYGAELSGDIEKYDIKSGIANYLYDSPYFGSYPTYGDLWFSEDGLRVFTKGKTVFRTSSIKDQDMLYNGIISLETKSAQIMNLDHSAIKDNIYIISSEDDTWTNKRKPFIYIYNSNNLLFKSKIELEKYIVGANIYEAEPYFVFCNSSGNSIYVFTKAKGSGLVNEWGLQKIDI